MSGSIRSVIVRLQAEVGQYVGGTRTARQATEQLTESMKEADRQSRQTSQSETQSSRESADAANRRKDALQGVGTTATAAGLATVAALGFATKAAMDWESAWAGVTKTIDGTPEQMAEIETGLRDMATTLPITHKELAAVAEAAGQLGVAREDVLGFTKVMVDLGESTNLTADEAATGIAQISNVMGTLEREGTEGISRFGATLVALGNAGASTEKEILGMAQRLAGAGKLVGATEGEVLALSNAMASVGIEAQLGGGVMSRVMQRMYGDVMKGGEGLDNLAKTAGVSSQQFAEAFRNDPVAAVDMMIQGLNGVKASGGNVMDTLSQLGIKGTEETSVILRLAGAGDLLASGLDLQATAWAENTALIDEATKRYETSGSKVKVAWNQIKDAAIDAGAVILPAVVGIAEAVGTVTSAFTDLPAPVQGALVGLTGVAGAGLLAAGGLMLIVPRAMETIGHLKTLNTTADGTSRKLGGLAKAGGVAAAAFVGASAIISWHNALQPATTSTEEFTQALVGLRKSKDSLDTLFSGIAFGEGDKFAGEIHNVGDALEALQNRSLTDHLASFGATALGVRNGNKILAESFENLDASLSGAVSSGSMESAAEGFKQVAEAAEGQGISLEEVGKRFPNYLNSLREAASAAKVQVGDAELLAWAMGEIPPAMEAATAASEGTAEAVSGVGTASAGAVELTDDMISRLQELGVTADGVIVNLSNFTDALFSAGLAHMSAREATFAWEDSLRDMGESITGVLNTQGELGAVLNDTATDFSTLTDSGKDANEMWQGYIEQGLGVASTFSGDVTKSLADVQGQLKSTYDAGVQSAMAFGMGKDEAIALTRAALQIPEGVTIESWMETAAKDMALETTGAVEAIPTQVQVLSAMDSVAKDMADGTTQSVHAIPAQAQIDSWMSDAAFQEALATKAAAENVPRDVAVASFMASAARDEADATTAKILGIPLGASVSSYMAAYARAEAEMLAGALNAVDGRVVNTYANHHETTFRSIVNDDRSGSPALGPGGRGGPTLATGGRVPRNAEGSKLPKHAAGYRLPSTGPGTDTVDGILGVSRKDGTPMSWLDGGEWVINERSSDKWDHLLRMINQDDQRLQSLRGLEGGGRPSLSGFYDGGQHARTETFPGMFHGSGAGGSLTAYLAPEDRQLLQALADRPINVAARLHVGDRDAGQIVQRGSRARHTMGG